MAVVLLWPPMPFKASYSKMLMTGRTGSLGLGGFLMSWQNWADFVRASIGVYALTVGIEIDPAVSGAGTKALLVKAAVLTPGVLLQVIRKHQKGLTFFAPVFYLSGVTLMLAGYSEGGFALFAGWLFCVGGKNPIYQLPVMGVALGVAGYIFNLSLPLMLNCALIFMPFVLGILFEKRLVIMSRSA
ncbi:MAG: hypothetical protein AB1813_27730 [Verrucomicrobiota bacterium]